jgi:hypothetical protein
MSSKPINIAPIGDIKLGLKIFFSSGTDGQMELPQTKEQGCTLPSA